MQKKISIEGMSCNHCVMSVKRELEKISGVDRAEVNLDEKMATVELENEVPDAVIEEAVVEAGFKVTGIAK
ncbi:heavy-metal-associated domain-containing protein [Spirochaetota bacterium]